MALTSRMIWGSGSAVRTFTGASGRVYTYAPVLDVFTADVAAGVTVGLTTLCQSGAVATGIGQTNFAVGSTQGNVDSSNPAGGQAALPNPALLSSGAGQVTPVTDPNRPAQPVSVGTLYLDAALQKLIVSTGTNWIDPVSGQPV